MKTASSHEVSADKFPFGPRIVTRSYSPVQHTVTPDTPVHNLILYKYVPVKVSIRLRFGHVSKRLVYLRTEVFSPRRLLHSCRRRHYEPSKRREPLTQRHGVTQQNIRILRTSGLALEHITVSEDVA